MSYHLNVNFIYNLISLIGNNIGCRLRGENQEISKNQNMEKKTFDMRKINLYLTFHRSPFSPSVDCSTCRTIGKGRTGGGIKVYQFATASFINNLFLPYVTNIFSLINHLMY